MLLRCGACRGQSQFRGVTRHHQAGRWEARIGRVRGNKYVYLGTFDRRGHLPDLSSACLCPPVPA